MVENELEARLNKKIATLQAQVNSVQIYAQRVHGQVTHPSVVGRIQTYLQSNLSDLLGTVHEIIVTNGTKVVFGKQNVVLKTPQDIDTVSTPQFAGVITAKIYPPADSATALQINKANGSTNVVNIDTTNSRVGVMGDLVLPKTAGNGVRVDTTTPTFGWRDILGDISVKTLGVSDPTMTVYRDGLYGYAFSNIVMNQVFNNFHIPHDYTPGSDIYIHLHWSQNVVDTGGTAGAPGVAKFYFEVSYAKGHNQTAFPASITTSVTQTASAVQYQHMLGEVQLSAASPSGSQIDSTLLEPDGIVIVRMYRDASDAADTLNQKPFVFYVDVHYQSTNIATKQKAPNFYV